MSTTIVTLKFHLRRNPENLLFQDKTIQMLLLAF